MYSMFFDEDHRVLMARVVGTLGVADLTGLNTAAAAFVASEGFMPFVLDLTAVDIVDIPMSELVGRAQRVAVLPVEMRVYVASDPAVFSLCRMFATRQRHAGNQEPLVVGTLDEAYQALGLVDPEFRPLHVAATRPGKPAA